MCLAALACFGADSSKRPVARRLTARDDLPQEAGLPVLVTPGTAPAPGKRADSHGLAPPKHFYYVDEGPQARSPRAQYRFHWILPV